MLKLVKHHYREGYYDFPHTAEELLNAKALRGWWYRAAQPYIMWQICDPEAGDYREHICFNLNINKARERWSKGTFVGIDNHQTFLVELISGFRVFVWFHDGGVYVGETVRLDKSTVTVEEVLLGIGPKYGQHQPREPLHRADDDAYGNPHRPEHSIIEGE